MVYSHVLRRSDGILQSYNMKRWVLGKEYRQLPRSRAAERQFGRRVRVYEKIKKVDKMWRCTMTCALYKSGQSDHKPQKKTVWAWAASREEAIRLAAKEYDRMAKDYCGHWDWRAWNDPSVAVEQVEFNAGLVGSVKLGR